MKDMARKVRDHSITNMEDYLFLIWYMVFVGSTLVYNANVKWVGFTSTKQSFWVAHAIVAVAAILVSFMNMRNRSFWQVFSGVLIGLAGYTMYIYWNIQRSICVIFICIALIMIVACVGLYCAVGKRKRQSIISYIFKKILASLHLSCMIVAIVALVACVAIPLLHKGSADHLGAKDLVFCEDEYQMNRVYGDEYRLANNLDRIKPAVDSDEWEALTLEQRQDTALAIIECEARYLGIPFKLTVEFSDDMPYEREGYYSHAEHLICINNEVLRNDGGIATMVAVLHEMRHCYQYSMCDVYANLSPEQRNLYCFIGVNTWCEGINNYVIGDEDYDEYKDQALEEDARDSAIEETIDYISSIKALLNEEEANESNVSETLTE